MADPIDRPRGRSYNECTPEEQAAIWGALAFEDDDEPAPASVEGGGPR